MAIEARISRRGWRAIYCVAVVLVSAPYLISLTSQLYSDDFILLYYYGRRSPWRVWEFFAPRTLWTYHPLQNLYYALCWRLSGVEPWTYRAASLALHLGTAFLLMKFGRDLTGSLHFGGWAALLFAGQWRHWEAVAWAGSIATVEATFFTILTCVAFVGFLRERRWWRYGLMIGAGLGWMFSKETVIQWPLLLVLIYVYVRWRASRARTADPGGKTSGGHEAMFRFERPPLGDLVLLVAVPVFLVAAYLVFYLFLVQNTYTFAELGYRWARPHLWARHVLAWLDRALNPLIDNEVVRQLIGERADGRLPLRWMAEPIERWHLTTVAVAAVVGYFLRLRRPLPLFALAMTLVLMMPYAVLIYAYYASRYHYASMLGASLLLAAVGGEIWRQTLGGRGGVHSWKRVIVASLAGLWVVASAFQLTVDLLHDRDENRLSRQLYDFFATQRDKADRRVLFVVDTRLLQKDPHFELGWGLLECARLATGSDDVAAVEIGFDLDRRLVWEFNTIGEKYLVRPGERGWEALRLSDDYILTVAADGRGGVVLERR